jgi:CheY-like chemotaxis protein
LPTTRSSRPTTILLVDDDSDFRMLLRDIIDTACSRVDVREASGGAAALEYLRRSLIDPQTPRPDLIYLDLEMPGQGGQEVLCAIKADPALAAIPVVILTGLDDQAQRSQAMRNGAAGYAVKPTEPRHFLRTVMSSVSRWVSLQADWRQDQPAARGEPGLERDENE